MNFRISCSNLVIKILLLLCFNAQVLLFIMSWISKSKKILPIWNKKAKVGVSQKGLLWRNFAASGLAIICIYLMKPLVVLSISICFAAGDLKREVQKNWSGSNLILTNHQYYYLWWQQSLFFVKMNFSTSIIT